MATETLAEQLQRNKDQVTLERTGSLTGQAGVYRHPQSGAEIITLYDPLYGDAQSEAALRVGFVRVRDAKPEEIHVLTVASEDAERQRKLVNSDSDVVKGLLARINALESERDAAKLPVTTTESAQAAAQAEGEAQTDSRGTDNTGSLGAGVGGVNTGTTVQPVTTTEPSEQPVEPEKPLRQMNKTELLAIVAAEQVEGVTEENTNKELVAAIEAQRVEKEVE